jgi:hypothetical protein
MRTPIVWFLFLAMTLEAQTAEVRAVLPTDTKALIRVAHWARDDLGAWLQARVPIANVGAPLGAAFVIADPCTGLLTLSVGALSTVVAIIERHFSAARSVATRICTGLLAGPA